MIILTVTKEDIGPEAPKLQGKLVNQIIEEIVQFSGAMITESTAKSEFMK